MVDNRSIPTHYQLIHTRDLRMITYVAEESVDVEKAISDSYKELFLMASRIGYKLSVAKELMDTLKKITMEPLVDSHIDMHKNINYFEYVNKLMVEVDALILVTKQSRRFKKYDVETVVNMAMTNINDTDGCQHDEVKLFMYSFLIYQLVAEVHCDILNMQMSDAWNLIPETLSFIEHDSIMGLKNVCDKIFKVTETKLCELLNITKFDPIIEETLGIRIDEIHESMSNYMNKLA